MARPIPCIPVKSSNIVAVGYDVDSKTLAVQFKNGTYHYPDVKPEVHAALVSADSVGRFFQEHIRGTYEGAKFEPERKDDKE